jgi:hypothetical protein
MNVFGEGFNLDATQNSMVARIPRESRGISYGAIL